MADEMWIAWMCCGQIEISESKEDAMEEMWRRREFDDDGHLVQLIEGPGGQTITGNDDEYLQYEKRLRADLDRQVTEERQARPRALGTVMIAFDESLRDRLGKYAPARHVNEWYKVACLHNEREVADTMERFTSALGTERVRFVPFPGRTVRDGAV